MDQRSLDIQAVGEHEPGSQGSGKAIPVSMLPRRDRTRISTWPARLENSTEPVLKHLQARRQTLIDPAPGHPAAYQLPELARHRLSLHTEDPIAWVVATRPNKRSEERR